MCGAQPSKLPHRAAVSSYGYYSSHQPRLLKINDQDVGWMSAATLPKAFHSLSRRGLCFVGDIF